MRGFARAIYYGLLPFMNYSSMVNEIPNETAYTRDPTLSEVPTQLTCPHVGLDSGMFLAHIYTREAIMDAMIEAAKHTGRNEIPPTEETKYAHVFGGGFSKQNFTFGGKCASGDDRFEFPILPDGSLFNGTVDQGIDRIVYSRNPSLENPTFCGLFRHNMTVAVNPPFLHCT